MSQTIQYFTRNASLKGFSLILPCVNHPKILTLSAIKIVSTMQELLEKIAATVEGFNKDAKAQVENGNKAAGTRARKASLEVEKMMKEFRKASLEASK